MRWRAEWKVKSTTFVKKNVLQTLKILSVNSHGVPHLNSSSVFQCPAITFQVALLGVEWVVLGIHHISLHQCVPVSSHHLPGGTTGSGVGCAGNPSHLITPVCPSVQPSPPRWHYWEWSGLCWESITSHHTSVSQCPAITSQVALLGVEWVVLGIHHISLH